MPDCIIGAHPIRQSDCDQVAKSTTCMPPLHSALHISLNYLLSEPINQPHNGILGIMVERLKNGEKKLIQPERVSGFKACGMFFHSWSRGDDAECKLFRDFIPCK